MSTGIVRLKWRKARAGYKLIEPGSLPSAFKGTILDGHDEGHMIVAHSGKTVDYTIGVRERDVFLELARTPPTEEGVLKFVNHWGLLVAGPQYEDFEGFLARQKKLQDAVRMAENGKAPAKLMRAIAGQTIGPLDVLFDASKQSLPQAYFEVRSLYQFCWLELMQCVVGQVNIACCPRCGSFLPIRRDGRSKEYCSGACKQAEYRKRKKDAVCL